MTILVREVQAEDTLWHDFDKAANQNHTPGDQALADLMRGYVDQTLQEERQRRIEAVEYANASIGLEGFELSQEYRDRQQQFIDGKIDTDGLVGEHDSRGR